MRDSKTGFIFMVEDRSARTLLPLIQRMVAPGTHIMSDGWKAYGGISALPEKYEHSVVNHSENFVDPADGTCTNGVEAYWSRCKRLFKTMSGTQEPLIPSYLDQFQWRERNGGTDKNKIFRNIVRAIAQWYPQ